MTDDELREQLSKICSQASTELTSQQRAKQPRYINTCISIKKYVDGHNSLDDISLKTCNGFDQENGSPENGAYLYGLYALESYGQSLSNPKLEELKVHLKSLYLARKTSDLTIWEKLQVIDLIAKPKLLAMSGIFDATEQWLQFNKNSISDYDADLIFCCSMHTLLTIIKVKIPSFKKDIPSVFGGMLNQLVVLENKLPLLLLKIKDKHAQLMEENLANKSPTDSTKGSENPPDQNLDFTLNDSDSASSEESDAESVSDDGYFEAREWPDLDGRNDSVNIEEGSLVNEMGTNDIHREPPPDHARNNNSLDRSKPLDPAVKPREVGLGKTNSQEPTLEQNIHQFCLNILTSNDEKDGEPKKKIILLRARLIAWSNLLANKQLSELLKSTQLLDKLNNHLLKENLTEELGAALKVSINQLQKKIDPVLKSIGLSQEEFIPWGIMLSKASPEELAYNLAKINSIKQKIADVLIFLDEVEQSSKILEQQASLDQFLQDHGIGEMNMKDEFKKKLNASCSIIIKRFVQWIINGFIWLFSQSNQSPKNGDDFDQRLRIRSRQTMVQLQKLNNELINQFSGCSNLISPKKQSESRDDTLKDEPYHLMQF